MTREWKLALLAGLGGAALSIAIVFGVAVLGLMPGPDRDAAIHDYLMAHPSILVDMSNKMQADQQRAAQELDIERMKATVEQQTKLAIAQIQAATDIQIAKIGKGMVDPTPPIPPPAMPTG